MHEVRRVPTSSCRRPPARRRTAIRLAACVAAFALALGLASPVVSWGANFKVYPTRVFIESKSKNAALRITNEADEPLNLELRAVSWDQDTDGKDQYAPTDQLLFFPRIATFKPKEERVVRIAYRGPTEGPGERTFRMIAEEMPPAPEPGRTQIRVLIRATIPVFVMPEGLSPQEEVGEELWTLDWVGVAEGKATIMVRNAGSRHMVPTNILLTASGGDGEPLTVAGKPWYVLRSRARVFSFPIPEAACVQMRDWKVEVMLAAQRKELSRSLTPEAQACAPPPPEEKERALPGEVRATAPESSPPPPPPLPIGDEGERKPLPR